MNTLYPYLMLALGLGAACTAVIIPIIISFCQKYVLFDKPNGRKVHHEAIPRLGGLAFLPSMGLGTIVSIIAYSSVYAQPQTFHWSAGLMVLGAVAIYIIGMLDDLMELKAITKFFIMAAAAAVMPFCNLMVDDLNGFLGLNEIPYWIAYLLTMLIIMTIVNSINLIDGIDGLASGLSIIPLCAYIWLYTQTGTVTFAIGAAALLGSVLVFFCFNVFGKAGHYKIFMGDAGSLLLGYCLAYLAVKYLLVNEKTQVFHTDALLTGYTLFVVPIFDLVRVAFTRLYLRIPIFQADKRHIHHILMSAGYTMHQSLGIILFLAIGFILLNYWLHIFSVPGTIIVVIDIMVYVAVFIYLRVRIHTSGKHMCQ